MDAGRGRWVLSLAIIAMAAVLSRVALWDVLANSWAFRGVPVSDAAYIDMWAVNILDGIGCTERIGYHESAAWRMPFMSVFLAAVYALFGYRYEPARVILLLVSVGICVAIAGIGRILFDRRSGFLAGLGCAFYYPLIFYATALMTESLTAMLCCCGVYCGLRASHERGSGFAAVSGVLLGAAGLTRIAAVTLAPVMVVYSAVSARPGARRRVAAAMLLCFLAVFLSWPVRNAVVLGRFYPGRSMGTILLWTSANPRYGGESYSRHAWRQTVWADPHASEMERDRRVRREAIQLVRENAAWYLASSVDRLAGYLRVPAWRGRDAEEQPLPTPVRRATWLAHWLGLAGICLALIRKPRSGAVLIALFAVYMLPHAVGGGLARFRLPAEWIWLVGAGYAVSVLTRIGVNPLLSKDPVRDAPLQTSIFRHRRVILCVSSGVLLPFAVLWARMTFMPAAPLSEAERQKQSRLIAAYLEGGGDGDREVPVDPQTLRGAGDYFDMAVSQGSSEIVYPADIVAWTGQVSHLNVASTGAIREFSLRVDMDGRRLGSVAVPCIVPPDLHLGGEARALRAPGAVVGTIGGTAALGQPEINVEALWINGERIEARRRRPDRQSDGAP